MIGYRESCKTMQRRNIKWEGVRIFNSLPAHVKTFQGTKEQFKILLDKFLETIPDQPQTNVWIPGAKDCYGNPS